jgi:hypothetical protein
MGRPYGLTSKIEDLGPCSFPERHGRRARSSRTMSKPSRRDATCYDQTDGGVGRAAAMAAAQDGRIWLSSGRCGRATLEVVVLMPRVLVASQAVMPLSARATQPSRDPGGLTSQRDRYCAAARPGARNTHEAVVDHSTLWHVRLSRRGLPRILGKVLLRGNSRRVQWAACRSLAELRSVARCRWWSSSEIFGSGYLPGRSSNRGGNDSRS